MAAADFGNEAAELATVIVGFQLRVGAGEGGLQSQELIRNVFVGKAEGSNFITAPVPTLQSFLTGKKELFVVGADCGPEGTFRIYRMHGVPRDGEEHVTRQTIK